MIRQLLTLFFLLPAAAYAHMGKNKEFIGDTTCTLDCTSGTTCQLCSGVPKCVISSCPTSLELVLGTNTGYWLLPIGKKFRCSENNKFCSASHRCIANNLACRPSDQPLTTALLEAPYLDVNIDEDGYLQMPSGEPVRCPEGFNLQKHMEGYICARK